MIVQKVMPYLDHLQMSAGDIEDKNRERKNGLGFTLSLLPQMTKSMISCVKITVLRLPKIDY